MTDQNHGLTRRKFMSTSLGCLATAGLAGVAPALARAEDQTASIEEPAGDVIYRKLGRTGLEIPIVSMGAGACNDPALVQACYESGMRHFDTGASYAFGRNEQMIANAIRRLGVRDKAIIGTKVHTPAQRNGLTPEQSRKTLLDTLAGSLRRLKTDYVDILYLHDVSDPAPIHDAAIKEAMTQAKEEGKARYLGVATHAGQAAVINAVVEAEIYDVVLAAFNFTMADDTDLIGAIAKAGQKGVGLLAMKTQAGGARFPNPETLRDYDGSVINSAALKWVLHNENISTTIPGIANFDHLRANMAVARNLEYTEEEKRFLSDNSLKLGMGFCRQCRKCLASCPQDIDIPNLMRTHMYAAQYADFQLARQTINEIPKTNGLQACASCTTCSASCANSVDIPGRISELKLMYA